jgi:hypothetical protein
MRSLLPRSGVIGAHGTGSTIVVEVETLRDPARRVVARWAGQLLAVAANAKLKADGHRTFSSAKVVDQRGRSLLSQPGTLFPGSSSTRLAPGACEKIAREYRPPRPIRGHPLPLLTVTEARTLPLDGGACIFVLWPDNITEWASWGGPLGSLRVPDGHPFLVEVVSARNQVVAVSGRSPAVGHPRSGFCWRKPELGRCGRG